MTMRKEREYKNEMCFNLNKQFDGWNLTIYTKYFAKWQQQPPIDHINNNNNEKVVIKIYIRSYIHQMW